MDELSAQFYGTFVVTSNPNDPTHPHPRFSQYKQKREGYGEQEARRRKMLDLQKTRRRDMVDYARRIAEEQLWDDDEMEEEGYDEVDSTHTEKLLHKAMDEDKKPREKKKKKRTNPYSYQLMLSEWMIDVPNDFEDSWLMVICPIGKRCLVISSKGKTKAYSRTGKFMKHFPSHLPGGCHKYQEPHNHYCILDCIFHEVLQTFFVLDIMCWRGHPVYDSDTEFRSFWLHTKISEEQERLSRQASSNPYKFLPLEYHSCNRETVTQLLSAGWKLEVDGLLFIHKRVHYTTGMSPLAAWLKPHMVSDVLGIPVSQQFLDSTPTLSSEISMSEQPSTSNNVSDLGGSMCTTP